MVTTMISSTSAVVMPGCSRAFAPALAALWEVNSPSAAMRRSRMPVRLKIQSSVASAIFSSSAVVRTLSGR
jgi:hypothetical protein